MRQQSCACGGDNSACTGYMVKSFGCCMCNIFIICDMLFISVCRTYMQFASHWWRSSLFDCKCVCCSGSFCRFNCFKGYVNTHQCLFSVRGCLVIYQRVCFEQRQVTQMSSMIEHCWEQNVRWVSEIRCRIDQQWRYGLHRLVFTSWLINSLRTCASLLLKTQT